MWFQGRQIRVFQRANGKSFSEYRSCFNFLLSSEYLYWVVIVSKITIFSWRDICFRFWELHFYVHSRAQTILKWSLFSESWTSSSLCLGTSQVSTVTPLKSETACALSLGCDYKFFTEWMVNRSPEQNDGVNIVYTRAFSFNLPKRYNAKSKGSFSMC